MAVKKGGLGKGFNSLFLENSVDDVSTGSVDKIKLIDIVANSQQPRKHFDEEALSELSRSISENGVLQPILVRPLSDGTYQIVAGERRWRASRMAGLTEIPAVVREMTPQEAMSFALIENLQREDLDPIEEAVGINDLIEKLDLTQEQVSQTLGKSRSSIANSLRLLNLPENVRQMLSQKIISVGHAKALLSLNDENMIYEVAQTVVNESLSVRQTEALVKKINLQKNTPPKPNSKRDVFYDEVQLALSENLGRKVNITCTKDRGNIKIEFFDKEDLKNLIKSLEQ